MLFVSSTFNPFKIQATIKTCRIPYDRSFLYPFFYVSAALLPVVRDSSGNRPGDVIPVTGQKVHVVAVDEAGLDENGRHGGAAQDAEVVALLDAAVVIAVVNALQTGDELVLDAGRECSGFARDLVAVSLGSSSAARIDVDADEEIRRPAIGGVDDTGPAGRFAAKVMALQQLHRAASLFEVTGGKAAVSDGQVAFAQTKGSIDTAGVRIPAQRMPGIDEYVHESSFIRRGCRHRSP